MTGMTNGVPTGVPPALRLSPEEARRVLDLAARVRERHPKVVPGAVLRAVVVAQLVDALGVEALAEAVGASARTAYRWKGEAAALVDEALYGPPEPGPYEPNEAAPDLDPVPEPPEDLVAPS